MVNYPIQLDEIDQWLADNFGIMPGACSSTESLRYNTARTIAEALWPKEQDHDACYQCEKNYDNVFFKGEQHAIKMMKEEAAEGMVGSLTVDVAENRCEITVIMPYAMLNRLGMIGYGYGLYLTKSGKNR